MIEGFKRQVVITASIKDGDTCKMCASGRTFESCCKAKHLAREKHALTKGGQRARDSFTMYCWEPTTQVHKAT